MMGWHRCPNAAIGGRDDIYRRRPPVPPRPARWRRRGVGRRSPRRLARGLGPGRCHTACGTGTAAGRRGHRPGPRADRPPPGPDGHHRRAGDPARRAARAARADRHQEGLRPGAVRRVHGARGRPAGAVLPDPRRVGGRPAGHHGRRAGAGGRAAPGPAGVHRLRRLPVRIVHLGADHVGGGAAPGGACGHRRGDPGVDVGQPVPVRRVPPHRRRGQAGPRRLGGGLMHAFDFTVAASADDAVDRAAGGAALLAGGTTLVDLMKLDVLTPRQVVDINALPLRGIAAGYPVIARALVQSASPQLRNMASIGGNLLQRTRCGYFRDVHTPCNKREPGSGCPAQAGENRGHAVLGTSTSCVATHASDLAVALVALDAWVRLYSRAGDRLVRLVDFYRLPGDTPQLENQLQQGELLTEVVVPALHWSTRSTYVKVRDRASYEFALASAAVALDVRGRRIRQARVAAGGVGTVPWRLRAVERALRGRPLVPESFEAAARSAADGARPLAHNGFKVALVQRTIVRALTEVARGVTA